MHHINPFLLVALFAVAAFVNGVVAQPSPSTLTQIAAPTRSATQAAAPRNDLQNIMNGLTPSQKAKMQQTGEYQAVEQMLQAQQQSETAAKPMQQGAWEGGPGPAVRPLNITEEMDSDVSGHGVDGELASTKQQSPSQQGVEQNIADATSAARYPGVKAIPLNDLPGGTPPMMPGPVLKQSSRKLGNKSPSGGDQPVGLPTKQHDFSHSALRNEMPKRRPFDPKDFLPPHKVEQRPQNGPKSPPNPLSIPEDSKGVHQIPQGPVPDTNEWRFYPPSQANEYHGDKKAALPLLHLKQLPPGSESWKKMREEEHSKRMPPPRPIAPLDWVKLGKIIKEMNEGTQQVQQHIKQLTAELKNIGARKKKANDKEGTLLQGEEDRLKGKLTMFKKVLYERQKKERVVQQALKKDQKRNSDDVQGLVYVNKAEAVKSGPPNRNA